MLDAAPTAPAVSCCGMLDGVHAPANATASGAELPTVAATVASAAQRAEVQRIAAAVLELAVFGDLRLKLTHPEFGPDGGWSAAFTERAIVEYARFLALAHTFGEAVPSNVIDEVWHGHIIDTRRYAADCERIFGRFLHHYPYFGLGGAHGERAELESKFARTRARYVAIFGEEPLRAVWGQAPSTAQ